ncbi:MAG: TIR domain-containing protein [Methanobacteriaceae archaeon]|jgi:methylmalonyl-CoA mutase cobalamin-binding subunit|nr:TIR domain-containing protein [Methanobacteriaceae archaeon]
MFEENKDNKIYNLIISNGTDENNERNQFLEKIYSKTDFLWTESVSSSYLTASDDFFNKVDVVIILSGLYTNNKEKIDELIEASIKNNKAILLVRPFGMEEVPENLEEIATAIVGWNANCVIGDIKSIVSRDD